MTNIASKFQNFVFTAAGVTLAASTIAVAPAEAFQLSLDPNLCSVPSTCTTSDYTGSTGLLDFNFEDSASGVLLNLTVTNTTSDAIGSTLVGVAFDLPDFVTAFDYDQQDSEYGQLYEDARLRPFDGTFDVGIRASARRARGNRSFAGGNPKGGLRQGESTTVSFTLDTGDLAADTVSSQFYNAYVNNQLQAAGRFQQVGPNGEESDKVLGIVQRITEPPQEVPEPTALLGLGLMGGAFSISRRKRAK